MKTFFKYFHNKQSRYISILLWAYEKRHIGFTKDELRSELSIFESEWPWVKWTFFGSLNGNSPLVWFISGEHMPDFQVDTQRFYLTPAGTSAAVDFLELQQAKRGGYIATAIGVVALLVSIVTGWLNYESLKVTQNSLELAAPTVLEIISDDTLFGVDQVKRAIGMIPAASSTAYFQLVNNST
ncbi:MAG TPA: hypothetical protein VLB83_02350, partial [Candidatus Paceibacterota bacterium]|nr:hypothetical protein [Candidatus Paceibacterota bacterium]